MRTRTLLLLAIACGVAILAAGVAQLLRLAGEDDPPTPATVGELVVIGDLRVTVEEFSETDGVVDTIIEIGGVDDADGTERFRLVVPGEALSPVTDGGAGGVPLCAGTTEEPQRCRLRFDLPVEPGTSRRLLLRRGDEQVSWQLSPA